MDLPFSCVVYKKSTVPPHFIPLRLEPPPPCLLESWSHIAAGGHFWVGWKHADAEFQVCESAVCMWRRFPPRHNFENIVARNCGLIHPLIHSPSLLNSEALHSPRLEEAMDAQCAAPAQDVFFEDAKFVQFRAQIHSSRVSKAPFNH